MFGFEQAIGWLVQAVGWLGRMRKKARRRIVKVRSYVRALRALENETGPEAEAWSKIAIAASSGDTATLTAEEAKYLDEFKGLWNRFLKSPLQVASGYVQQVAGALADIDI